MPLIVKKTEVTRPPSQNQDKRAADALSARRIACGSWRAVALELAEEFDASYLLRVAKMGKHPSRRLLRALGIVKPEKSYGVRIRLSMAEAWEAAHGRLSVGLQLRIARAWINAGGDEGK